MQIKRESLAFVLIASIIITCSAVGAVQVFSTTVPICFIQNDGQTDDQVLYFADAAGYTLYLTAGGEVISTADPVSVVEITYPGINAAMMVSGENELPGKANFFIGNDEDQWVTNVPMYSSVRYDGLYEGISLVYHGGVSTLKKEFIVEPGADPSGIRMQYVGQEGLALDENGALLVTTAAGTFIESPPVCYQVVGGAEVAVPCKFVLGEDGVVTFSVGAYDTTLPLVIDPQYDFSTYLGGAQDDRGAGVGMDDSGNVYVAGSTQSTQFPLANSPPYQQKLNGSWDVFVSKFSPDGSQLLYSTYIGGNRTDLAGGMAVRNDTGEVFITGSTDSLNYPSLPPYSVYLKDGFTDAFVTSVDATGSALRWSTYYGGNKSDEGTAIALDYNGNPVIVGFTASDVFTSFSMANTFSGATDGFVAKFDYANGNNLWGRYLGGSSFDYAYGVAIEYVSWDVWLTGSTKSLNFPTTPAIPPYPFRNSNSGATDAFVTKVDWTGSPIEYSTYLGGASNDFGTAIALDPDNYPYITGYTESPVSPISLFPIKPYFEAYQTSFGGGQWDAFVTKMERNLSAINYSTYLGGSDEDKGYGIAVDNWGTAFVTGWTMSEDFPTQYPIQPDKGLGFRVPDAFVTQVNETGTGLIYSSYLGGTYFDEGKAIAITPDGINISVTGNTESIDFPKVNAYQPYLAGFPAVRFTDAFVTKIVKQVPIVDFIADPISGCSPLTVNFTDLSTSELYPITGWFWEFGDGKNSTEQNPTHVYWRNASTPRRFNVTLTATNQDGKASLTKIRYIRVCPSLIANFTANKTNGCVGTNSTIRFLNWTTGDPDLLFWDFGDGTNATTTTQAGINHKYNNPGLYTVTLTVNNSCCNNTLVRTEYIDIRAPPVANFTADPRIGAVPLDVQFNDTSYGRPQTWFWSFGAGEGNSTVQNPLYTYETKGNFRVKLQVCNFCGCSWNNSTSAYIKAGAPKLSFVAGITKVLPNGTIIVPTNDTTPVYMVLEKAENGLSGYDVIAFWCDSLNGNITGVTFPSWAMNKSHTPLPDYNVQMKAVDIMDQVGIGATNVLLASLDLRGRDNIPTSPSTICFNSSVNELDDNFGDPIYPASVPANIMVVRLLPFPGKVNVPKDPNGDQVYWDVNGNGHIDFNDVTTFFQNMQWIRDNQYVPFFDYNGNGLIDFADLILLFHEV